MVRLQAGAVMWAMTRIGRAGMAEGLRVWSTVQGAIPVQRPPAMLSPFVHGFGMFAVTAPVLVFDGFPRVFVETGVDGLASPSVRPQNARKPTISVRRAGRKR